MKINGDLRLREADNKNFVVAIGEKSKTFCNTVKLNDTAKEVFKSLKNGETKEEIAQKLQREYGISFETALLDVSDVILQFEKAGFFDD